MILPKPPEAVKARLLNLFVDMSLSHTIKKNTEAEPAVYVVKEEPAV